MGVHPHDALVAHDNGRFCDGLHCDAHALGVELLAQDDELRAVTELLSLGVLQERLAHDGAGRCSDGRGDGQLRFHAFQLGDNARKDGDDPLASRIDNPCLG